MAALDPVDKKILSAKGNVTDSNSPSDLIVSISLRNTTAFLSTTALRAI